MGSTPSPSQSRLGRIKDPGTKRTNTGVGIDFKTKTKHDWDTNNNVML